MNRREFLTGTLAVGLLPPLFTPAMSAESQPGMTLGCSTYGLKSFTTEKAIDLIENTGFDSIELTIWPDWDLDPVKVDAGRRKRIRERLKQSPLRLTALMEDLHVQKKGEDLSDRLERIKRAAELAHDLTPESPPIMQTVLHGQRSSPEILQQYAEELGEWVKVADSVDLLIAFKPHRGSTVSRPDEAVWIIETLNRPKNLRMCFDYSHYDLRDMTLEGTVSQALPWIAHVAVKDVVPAGNGTRFVLPGEGGRIDYPHLLTLLQRGNYRGDISCEVSGQVSSRPDYDPEAAVSQCYTNMSAAFAQAGISRPQKND
ncbi:sugar phosphate isomerase/epimerase family protein [Planctomicrobium sp. SH661]|uniref:sugar phosphate isomerase/epimerase family protein n=1 Tax=Planctomicrobium sp. SH661 TaxID=3448124 RepID=UPI003F5C1529